MDQNFNNTQQHNNENTHGIIFGDNNFFSFDPAALDHHQPSGQTILNDTEDNYLTNFFDNPNMAQQAAHFETMFGMDDKSQLSHFAAFGSHAMNMQQNPISTPLNTPLPKTHVIAHAGSSNSEQHVPGANGQTPELDNGLYDAANSLFNLTKPQPQYPQTASNQHISGSWGNLFNPNVTMGHDMNRGAYPAAADHTSFAGGQGSFTPQANSRQHWSGDMAHVTSQQDGHATSESTHFGYPVQQQQQQPLWRGAQPDSSSSSLPQAPERRSALMSFGSDPGFSSTHFSGPASTIEYDKDGNLLNVPHADKVRSPFAGHPFPTLNDPGSSSAYRTGAQMQPPHQGVASWGSLRTADVAPRHNAESSTSQARKRRKSQAVAADEQEWTPNVGGHSRAIKLEDDDEDDDIIASRPSNKRRRSTDSNSPPASDDDDEETAASKKRGSKKRDNLTEEEKRRNHIQSEKKRREIIQQGYSDLSKLVPSLMSGKSGLSRSECLQEIASYLETLVDGNNDMMRALGMSDNDEPFASIMRQMQANADAIEK